MISIVKTGFIVSCLVLTAPLRLFNVVGQSSTSSEFIQLFTPPFAIVNEMLESGYGAHVQTDSGILEIASFDWSLLDGTETNYPFIICVEGGREGVVNLQRTWRVHDSEPMWCKGSMSCYSVYSTFQDIRTTQSLVPQVKYVFPFSGLYQLEKGIIDLVSSQTFMSDSHECTSGLQFRVPSSVSTDSVMNNNFIEKIIQDMSSSTNLLNIVQQNFYWLATEGLASQEPTPTSLVWVKGLHNISSNTIPCDYSKAIISTEGELVTISNLCQLSGSSLEKSSDCLLLLLAYLSTLPEVSYLENVHKVFAFNINAARITQSGNSSSVGYPFWNAGLNGTGQSVQVIDTGLDYNNCYFKDTFGVAPPFSTTTTCTLTASYNGTLRKVVQYTVGAGAVNVDVNFHGTHVAGTVGGYSPGTTPGIITQSGMAPGAKIFFFGANNYRGALVGVPANMSNAFKCGYAFGNRIFSASIGTTSYVYSNTALAMDQYLYYNDDFMELVSAANYGGYGRNTASISSFAQGKNTITVGSSLNWLGNLPTGFNYANMTRVSSFSSIGPATQGRIKPDFVAPGQVVNSAAVNTTCGVRGASGTSMACPSASGSMAIIRQYFVDGYYPTGIKTPGNEITNPSGALLKASLITSARHMVDYESSSSPTEKTGLPIPSTPNIWAGFGLISLNRVLRLNNEAYPIIYVKDRVSLSEGQVITYKFSIPTTSKVMAPFVISIVWTDPPSSASSGGAVLNNLDITATLDSDTKRRIIYPNSGNGPDIVNNVERITINKPLLGDVITVKVIGSRIAVTQTQNYAMVAAGVYTPAAWYCQNPRSIRPNTLYTTANCRIPCQTFKRNPICCAADAGDFCTPEQASDSYCINLTKPSNC